jgi:HemY protein
MPWLQWVRFETAARRQAWGDAGEALDLLAPSRLLEPEALRRHRAALSIAMSQDKARQGNAAASLESAELAARQAPDWMPALINLARRQAVGGYARAARRTVEKGWKQQPHPQLAEALLAGGHDPMENYRQIERLCRGSESDPASRMVLAEAALDADIWGEARRHLAALVAQQQATQETYRLLAQLERRESGDERAALQWLTKAAEAAPDPAWLCSACGGAHRDWQGTCPSCGAFATLEWRKPGASRMGGPAATPLLSGWSE